MGARVHMLNAMRRGAEAPAAAAGPPAMQSPDHSADPPHAYGRLYVLTPWVRSEAFRPSDRCHGMRDALVCGMYLRWGQGWCSLGCWCRGWFTMRKV